MADSARSLRRRQLLTGGLAAAGGAASGAVLTGLLRDPDPGPNPQRPLGEAVEAFHGAHQAGIATPAQAHAVFIAFDLREDTTGDRIPALLKLLSDDAARLTAGEPALADTEPELARDPARLTVTVGFGPGLFTAAGVERLRPDGIAALPSFDVDRLEDRWSGGDLLLQICAEDPLTVSHAVRMLVKDTRAFATVRWVQKGFRHAHGSRAAGATPRNVMGQLDGTVNPAPDASDFIATVWADSGPEWWRGGTTLVLRRIRVELEEWDAVDRTAKELVIGRRLDDGAPLTGDKETDEPDFKATNDLGLPIIPDNAHVQRARDPEGARIFRRVYNYDETPDSAGTADTGLVFASYQAHVDQFVKIQRRIDEADMLNRWVTPIGSAVFAIPPGCAKGEWIGRRLFDG